ncbi:MAG: glycoside hydrolase family 5 protein [Mycobacteriales bacterium]
MPNHSWIQRGLVVLLVSVIVAPILFAATPSAAATSKIRPIPEVHAVPRALPALPLRTKGRWIVDAHGTHIKLASANWFGAESPEYVVGGLDTVSLDSITHWLAGHGFNSVRLPWSNEMLEKNPLVKPQYLEANPQLKGLHALEIFDRVVVSAATHGLMVVLDNHRGSAQWCCDEDHGDGLWYSRKYPESAWVNDWKTMVARYHNQPAVVGAELRNEIRPDPAITHDKPSWNDGNTSTDWKRAAQLSGDAVLATNPNLLVIVGGLEYQGTLEAAYSNPAWLSLPNRIVYAAHDYVWFHDGKEHTSYPVFKQKLEEKWGKILHSGRASTSPVYVSEFGVCGSGQCSLTDLEYIRFITRYLKETDADWAYWPLNGTQSQGYSRAHGTSETYGLLDETWRHNRNDLVLALLIIVQRPRRGPGIQ